MAPKLKLHRGTNGSDKHGEGDARSPRDVLPFPAEGVRTRSLVAGRVNRRASRGHDFNPRFDGEPANPEVLSHADLVRDIDRTLDAMQKRVSKLKRETGSSLKFPNLNDDDRLPPAA
ncbi:MAG: hypothetical protein KF768_04615 [Phycisphaeraceae bacterium]|nr:hypothetical protein [Phycisphaeraceae bacterium]